MIESGLLKALLLDIIFGGAAGVVVWQFVESKAGQALRDRLAAWLGYFGLEPPEVTRYLTMTLSVLVSLAAYGVALVFAFVPDPGTVEGWLNLVIQLFSIAYTTSQVCHARRKTRLVLRRRMNPVDPTTTTEDALLASASNVFPVGDGGYVFWDESGNLCYEPEG